MNVQSHVMSQTMNEVLAQWLAMRIFAMRIDVIHSNFVEGVRVVPCQLRFSDLEGLHGRFLRSQHNVINLTLPGRKLTVHWSGAGNVSGIHGVFPAYVHHYYVAALHGG